MNSNIYTESESHGLLIGFIVHFTNTSLLFEYNIWWESVNMLSHSVVSGYQNTNFITFI